MISVKPKFQALSLRLRSPAGAVKMPLAQAHPFQPMAVTHEEELHEVSAVLTVSPVVYRYTSRVLHNVLNMGFLVSCSPGKSLQNKTNECEVEVLA